MASHIFCPTCGSKNDFINGRKPNFCSACGYNFQSLAAFGGSTPIRPSRSTETQSAMDVSIDAEEAGEFEGAGISKADVQIDGIAPVQKMKVGEILNTASQGYDGARHEMTRSTKRVNGKKAFELFKEEAGFGGAKRSEIGE